jgi:hypothetical protein
VLYVPHINCPYCGGATINTNSKEYKNRYSMERSHDSAWLLDARGTALLTIYRSLLDGHRNSLPINEQQWQRIVDRVAEIIKEELNT